MALEKLLRKFIVPLVTAGAIVTGINQASAGVCTDRDDLVNKLKSDYRETASAHGTIDSGDTWELFTSNSGSWEEPI